MRQRPEELRRPEIAGSRTPVGQDRVHSSRVPLFEPAAAVAAAPGTASPYFAAAATAAVFVVLAYLILGGA
jgi:hypothetical protein